MINVSSLVGYWNFEGNANDVSGNSKNGTVTGATLTTGKFGKCYSFDGIDDYINISSSLLPSSWDGGYTASAWFKCSSGSGSRRFIFESTGTFTISMGLTSGGELQAYAVDENSAYHAATSGSTYDDGDWHFVASVYGDDRRLRLYVDGIYIAISSTFTSDTIADTTGFNIGTYRTANGRWFPGEIDEVSVFDKVYELPDIKRIMLGLHPLA